MKMDFIKKSPGKLRYFTFVPKLALYMIQAVARLSAASDVVYTWAVSHEARPARYKNDVSRSGMAREQDSSFFEFLAHFC